MRYTMVLILFALTFSATGDTGPEGLPVPEVPEYLSHFPGLFVRENDEIIDAPEEDIVLAMSYPLWEDRGKLLDGRRITIMIDRETFQVGEEARIIHVVEAPEPGWSVYIMGPKVVYGEYVNGELATEPEPGWEDPFVPELYNGAVFESPAVDYNYDISTYSFDEPGFHEIQWLLGPWESNIIVIKVVR